MPDLTQEPWATLVAFAVERVLPALVIIVAAWLLLRMSRVFVRGIVQALMDRESSEGTAQELTAIEQRKRMDTLDALLGWVLTFFIVVIAREQASDVLVELLFFKGSSTTVVLLLAIASSSECGERSRY